MTFRKNSVLSSCSWFIINPFRKFFQNSCVRKRQMADKNDKKRKPSTQLMEIPTIVSVYRQSVRTFEHLSPKDPGFQSQLAKLKFFVDQLTAEDVALDSSYADPDFWSMSKKAPCSYIEIFQNDALSLSIFLLKPGFKMPLHDHPHMYGLLKVILGACKIRSFSKYDMNNENQQKHNICLAQSKRFFAKLENDSILGVNSEACILTPNENNYHEIQALSEPVAFFDILAPPYETYIQEFGPRKCSYYKIQRELSTNVVEMREISTPSSFYCDQAPYLGPTLH